MKNPTPRERRRLQRRNISYYLPILDSHTRKIIGHLVDISPVGLLMDSMIPIQIDQKYNLCLDFVEEIAGKASLDFAARSIWCQPDPIQPNAYNVGLEIISISPGDIEIIKRIAMQYGAG